MTNTKLTVMNRRSAAELDELFERGIKPWRFHKTATATERLVNAGIDRDVAEDAEKRGL